VCVSLSLVQSPVTLGYVPRMQRRRRRRSPTCVFPRITCDVRFRHRSEGRPHHGRTFVVATLPCNLPLIACFLALSGSRFPLPELIPVLGSQPAGDVSHEPGGRLPLLSARPAVTPVTRKRAAINFAAW